MARHFLFSSLIIILFSGSSISEEPVVKINVVSDQQNQKVQVIVENFTISGIDQDDLQLEIPFILDVSSKEFELTLKLKNGDSDLRAYTMRKRETAWVHGGLTGIGKIVHFKLSENRGQVWISPVQ